MKAVGSSQLAVVKNYSDTEILEIFDWLVISTPDALVVWVIGNFCEGLESRFCAYPDS